MSSDLSFFRLSLHNGAGRIFYFHSALMFVTIRRLLPIIGTAVLFLAAAAALAHGQLYQYVDKSGNTVYTDGPPQNVESRQKSLPEDGIYWSAAEDEGHAVSTGRNSSSEKLKSAERSEKKYNRLMVVMYMTDW